MTEDAADRAEILAKLAATRAEVRRVFEPPHRNSGGAADGVDSAGTASGGFPRSRTMRMLLSGAGLKTLGALATGLILARPTLALRLLRLVPAGAVAKTLLLRAVSAMRSTSPRR